MKEFGYLPIKYSNRSLFESYIYIISKIQGSLILFSLNSCATKPFYQTKFFYKCEINE